VSDEQRARHTHARSRHVEEVGAQDRREEVMISV